MTLLSICRAVADEVGLPRSDAYAASTDQLSRQMVALANAALRDLALMEWPVLETQYSFPTVIGQEAYALPADYAAMVTDTAFVSTMYYQLRGSLSANEWQRRRNGLPSEIGRYRFRIMNDPLTFNITPIPQLVETITIEYVSNAYARSAANALIPQFTSDTDTPRFPEQLVLLGLKWRIKDAKGLDFSQSFNEYESTKKTMLAKQKSLGFVPVGYRSYADVPELGDGYVPETGFGS